MSNKDSLKKTEEELKKKAEQLKTLYELGKRTTSLLSKEELLPWIAKQAAKLLDADTCNYRIREGDYLVRGGGTEEGMELMKKEKLKIGESLSGWIAKEKKPVIISDNYSDDPRLIPEHQEKAKKYGFRSALGVPMCIEERVVGVLVVVSKRPREFTEKDIDILTSFAGHAAIAIENSRLYEEAINRVTQFKALYEVNKLIASELEKGDLLPLIAEQARNLLGADGCNFRLREGNELVCSFGTEESEALMVKERIKIGESLGGIIAEKREPLVIEDIRQDERYIEEHRKVAKKLGFVSFVGVPMMIRNEVIGVIHVFSKEPRRFSLRDIEFLSAFADQAAIAVRNAEYLERIKEAQNYAIRSEKLASIGQLASGVAHEIMNPLNIILGRIQLLMMEKDINYDRLIKPLNIMKDQANRIVTISKSLLNFSRERKAEYKEGIDINHVIKDSLFLVEKELLLENIKIEKEFNENLPLMKADDNQLRQVFVNLITNAKDAVRNEGTITISTDLNQKENKILVSIKDTGHGIPEENLGKIFDPFFTTKEEGRGTGLGLSVCHGILEGHGGKIWAVNNENKGSTFFIELPFSKKSF